LSYDLEVHSNGRAVLSRDDLHATVRALAPALPVLDREGRLASDGAGFALDHTPRGTVLTAGPARGPGDEHLMEIAALVLARPSGSVIDRHTGRPWTAALLAEWLAVAPLLSGRALAVNEERIAHRPEPAAARGFTARVEALTAHATGGAATAGFTARLRDELQHYAARSQLEWPVARGLARLGDFSGLEALSRAATGDLDAFAVAAEHGAAALPLFQRALGDADPNYRRAAARALHRIADAAVLPLVARALEDKRSTVREAVLEADFGRVLSLPGARTALAPTLARLAHDPSSLVRRHCARWI
jgi:hypothetical protein